MAQVVPSTHEADRTCTELFARSLEWVGESVHRYDQRAVRIWLFSAIFWLTFVDLVGLIMALELVTPNLFGGVSRLLFSRLRPIHVNGVLFAWLSTMYFGAAFYILPRLLGVSKLWSESLTYWCAWGWNLMLALGVVSLASQKAISKRVMSMQMWEWFGDAQGLTANWQGCVLSEVLAA